MSVENSSPAKPGKKTVSLTVVLIALVVGYVFARPHAERIFNITLPHLVENERDKQNKEEEKKVIQKEENNQHEEVANNETPKKKITLPPVTSKRNTKPTNKQSKPANKKVAVTTPPKTTTTKKTPKKTISTSTKTPPRTTNMPVLGQLKKISGNILVSTAGLRYKPGSREGHRTKHIMKHSKDQPNRPGSHGVFDGDQAEIFAVIDEAYLIATKRGPPQARIKKEDKRTIYTVHLKRKVGYLGGQTGKRKKNPSLYYIRLVLEGKNVITAFPMKP